MRQARRLEVALRLFLCGGLLLCAAEAGAQTQAVGFDSDRWDLRRAQVTQHLGRQALAGVAYLKDVEFENGVIEVDVAVDGSRSYPGIIFRMQSEENYERFYIRPHRAGLYPDALQYTPVFNRVACWQLYHGPGCTAGATIAAGEWIRVRLEVQGTQARVLLGESDEPALFITHLKHGVSRGWIGVLGPGNGTAYFSNFRYSGSDDLSFPEPSPAEMPEHTLTEWQLSRRLDADRVNTDAYPEFFPVFFAEWQDVPAEPPGLVNVCRFVERTPSGPDCVWARTMISSDTRRGVKLTFGYSDDVALFVNGRKLFGGVSGYRSRDASFLGVVGPYDSVHVPLEKGLNEVFLMVTERFGGWGFLCRADRELNPPVRQHELLTKVWETPASFKIPESALYDAEEEVVFVTSFDKVGRRTSPTGFISRLALDGSIEELEWVTGLDGPCGMALRDGRLYVAESGGNLLEIDTATAAVARRTPIAGATFLNDVTIDDDGIVYVSDSTRGAGGRDIYRCENGECDLWVEGDELHRANGLLFDGDSVVVGNTGDATLKLVDPADKRVRTLTSLGAGVVDGIRLDGAGNYLVSRWEGQVYRVSPSGDVVELLDATGTGLNTADFEFVAEKNLLIIPTFLGNKVVAYRLEPA
jgi:sugar lactone lactonase YvrE